MHSSTAAPFEGSDIEQSFDSQQDRETRTWTILFYLCGDHGQLSARIRKNLQDIESMQPSEHLYVAVQHDLANEEEGAKRFIIADRSEKPGRKMSLGEVNTGDPETALEFFRWGIDQCPSEHIAIIFGGTGIAEPHSIVGNVDVLGDYEQLFAFCDDKTAEDAMTPVELGKIFTGLVEDRDGEPIDLVAFDMCSMQYLEIVYQLKSLVRVVIGSQNNEKAPEWSYSKLIKDCVNLLNSVASTERSVPAGPPRDSQGDPAEMFADIGYADPNDPPDLNDPRVLAAVAVRAISHNYHRKYNRSLRPIVSALDLTHLDKVTRSLDTLFLALMFSLGNGVVWEARHRTFKKLLEDYKASIKGFKELRRREMIGYDLLNLLRTLSAKLTEVSEKEPLEFWYYEQQLKKYSQLPATSDKWHKELGSGKLHDEAEDPERRKFLDAQIELPDVGKFIATFEGDLQTRLEKAFDKLRETQRETSNRPRGRDQNSNESLPPQLVRDLEAMWHDYHNLNLEQLAKDIENAKHLQGITDEVAELFEPAPENEATNGQCFVLASEPRRKQGSGLERCGVLIHRPEHLDKLSGSGYLELEFHRQVHWLTLLGAVNMIGNHPRAMWRIISSLLSTASAAARDDLLSRLVGPDSVVSGFGNQFRALSRPPCVTLSIEDGIEEQTSEQNAESVRPTTENQTKSNKKYGYHLILESSRKGATVTKQFNRVNQQTIKSTLSRLEDMLKYPWVDEQDMRSFEALGKTLGEDVIQKLNCQLHEEWQHVLEEDPENVLHMQLQLPLELMRYPWELMHDGKAFLGERYGLGRQLYMGSGMAKRVPRRKDRKIKILIIGDPQLDAAGPFQQLISAREEAKEVADQFQRLSKEMRGALDFKRERDVYIQETVTTHQFRDWLRSGDYDIIHFAGHADYIEGDSERSAWIFSNGPLWAVEIRNTLSECKSAPWLVFANACESSMGEGQPAGYQSNVFGLATAFINEGVTAYVGPLWPINDSVALQMAKDFYESLLLERASIGESLRFAKVKAKEATLVDIGPDAFVGTHTGLSWASLILYGDPTMKLMDTLGTASLGNEPRQSPTAEVQQTKQREKQKLARRRRYSASGFRQRPVQSSVSETQKLLGGPGMDAKILNSRQVSKEIPDGKYALELEEVNGVRFWQFFDGNQYRSLNGSIIKEDLQTNKALRAALGLPRVNTEPLAPRPIGHWLIDRNEDSILKLVNQYDLGKVATEQFLRIHADRTTIPLGKAGLRGVSDVTEGKLRRVLLILHDTLCDTNSVVSALGEQFIRWACRNYGAVIGFDHWTLSKSPKENANELWDDLLKQLGERTNDENRIDILAHGRGGLVARALVENQNTEKPDPSKSVRHVVFAGTPNAGTDLADPNLWGQAADMLVNMAHVDGSGMYGSLSGLLARLSSLQQSLDSPAQRSIDRQFPGLRTLLPSTLKRFEEWPSKVKHIVKYSGIAAVYEPGNQRNFLGIMNECTSKSKRRPPEILFGVPNDLMANSFSVWDSEELRSTENCKLLLLNPNLRQDELRKLGDGRSLKLGALQAGVHRTNMLSLKATQEFLRERLVGEN